jgi:hypothetical protein
MANPDPKTDHLSPWQPGQSGNPGGFTAEQVEKRKANRDRAFALEEKMLAALERDMTQNEAAILDHIRADVLRLIHTAIERVDGKPQQRVDATSSDGTMSPRGHSDAVLDALRAKHAPASDGEAP